MLFLYCVASYLIGAVPVAYIYCKLRGVDIRQHGSGNVGATNAARIFGRNAFMIVTLFDALKGFIPVYFAGYVGKHVLSSEEIFYFTVLNFMLTVVGHMFPVYLKFKGGKGVNTSIGSVMALFPYAGVLTILTFALVFKGSKIVSLSSMIAAVFFPIFLYVLGSETREIVFGICLGSALVIAHKNNIKRLLKGDESSFKKKT